MQIVSDYEHAEALLEALPGCSALTPVAWSRTATNCVNYIFFKHRSQHVSDMQPFEQQELVQRRKLVDDASCGGKRGVT